MEEIKNELKKIALDIIQSNEDNIENWLKSTSTLYEKLLVIKYLKERDLKLAEIRNQVESELHKIVDNSSPVEPEEIEAPAPPKKEEPKIDPIAHREIRVVPHPEGPAGQ